jgi:hypothetical protein
MTKEPTDLIDKAKSFFEDNEFLVKNDTSADGVRTIYATGKITLGFERIVSLDDRLSLIEIPHPVTGANIARTLKRDSFMADYASIYNEYPQKVVLASNNLKIIVENKKV